MRNVKSKQWRLQCIALLHLIISIEVDMQNGPDNSAVLIGSSTILRCRDTLTNCTTKANPGNLDIWNQRVPGSAEDINILERWNSDRISMNETCIGQYDLFIRNATFDDAGTFICITLLVQYTAELVVLDADPKCYMSDNESDHILLRCAVQYRGNWHPKMTWRNLNGRLEVPSISTNTTNRDVISLTSTVARSTIPTLSLQSTVQFTCEMFFDLLDYHPIHDPLSNDATNLPTYRYVWESPMIKTGNNLRDPTLEADENDTITNSIRECHHPNHNMIVVADKSSADIINMQTGGHTEEHLIDSGNIASSVYEEIIEETYPNESSGVGNIQSNVFQPGRDRGHVPERVCYLNIAEESEYQNETCESNRTDSDEKRTQTNYSVLECRTKETPQPPSEYQGVKRKKKKKIH